MKIAVIGGGGSRVPVLYRGILDRRTHLGVDRLALYDVDDARLARVAKVLRGMGMDDDRGKGLDVCLTTRLDEALEGADFVLSAIRVGGFEARVLDERIALDHGVFGQETVGPGGFALAVRNVPAMAALAERIRTLCPDAWLVNLANPAGMVTQALDPLLDGRVVGVCDSPVALGRSVADALGADLADLHLGYAGLNHLGWLSSVWHGGRDRLPELLASPAAERVEEVRLFGADAVRATGAIPNEYVYFYDRTDVAMRNIGDAASRGAFLLDEERALAGALEAAGSGDEALAAYRRSLGARSDSYMSLEAGVHRAESSDPFASADGYHEMALSVVEAICTDRPTVLVVNTRNRGALPFLADDDVVEVPAVVRAAGVFPLAADVPADRRDLVVRVKRFERATLAAIGCGSVTAARDALALHPLVPGADVAAAVLEDYLARIPGVAAGLGVAT